MEVSSMKSKIDGCKHEAKSWKNKVEKLHAEYESEQREFNAEIAESVGTSVGANSSSSSSSSSSASDVIDKLPIHNEKELDVSEKNIESVKREITLLEAAKDK